MNSRLVSLTISGFKSFARKTQLHFRFPMTAIIGPNGCGKSNISDAFRWVLGEKSAQLLRSPRMTDLLFNGTSTEEAKNMAEVTALFDNSDSFFPLDSAEIAVSRRLYRSGESEYLINATPVRLQDIRALFYDTGMGVGAYSILEQGKIDQILSQKPEERRKYFEEAAGISAIRAQSRSAKDNYSRASENMKSMAKQRKDFEKKLSQLDVQCRHVERYRELQQQKRNYEIQAEKAHIEKLLTTLKEHEEKLLKMKGQISSNEGKEALATQKQIKLREIQKNLSENILSLGAEISQLRISQVQWNEDRRHTAERHKEALRICEEQKNRLAFLQTRIDSEEKKQESLELQKKAMSAQKDAIESSKQETDQVYHEKLTQLLEKREKNQKTLLLSEKQEKTLHSHIAELAEELIHRLDKMFHLWDQQDLQSLHADLQKLFSHKHTSLLSPDILAQLIGQIEKKWTPSYQLFLDTFHTLLDPRGSLTQKRELDVRITDLRNNNQKISENIKVSYTHEKELVQKIDDIRNEKTKRLQKIEKLSQDLRYLSRQSEQMQQSLSEYRQERDFLSKKHKESTIYIEKLAQKLSENWRNINQEKMDDLGGKQKDLEKKRHKTQEDLKFLDAQLDRERENKRLHEERRQRHDNARLELQTRIDTLTETFFKRYAVNLNEQEWKGENEVDLRAKIQQLSREMRHKDKLNFLAADEKKELEGDYEAFSSAEQDVIQSMKRFHDIHYQAEAQAIETFLNTVNSIQIEFAKVFTTIFGGGRAEIFLEDSENPMESGIQIRVKPPGKNLKHLSLLSGGERSLCAIALLLATYSVHPSPLCILDEVDAMLDESNVHRFVHLLRSFCDKTQFVIISHNIQTTAAMDTVMGITMEEAGISKVVSIRIEQKDDLMQKEESPSSSSLEYSLEQ